MRMKKPGLFQLSLLAVAAACAAGSSLASSHREAPFITTSPKVDGTDFYMFRSYEGVAANGTGGRSDFVTLIANYQPLQGPYGGPNYFSMDPNALYEIHIDNNGDAAEDITFQFRFNNKLNNVALPIGNKSVAIPLIQAGPVANVTDANLNVNETYTVNVVRGDRRKGGAQAVTKVAGGSATFEKPVDYIGVKTLGNSAAYAAYAGKHIHDIKIPGCPAGKDTGRVFVGQRQEGFAVNLGPIFDLVNAPLAVITNPANINIAAANSIQDLNITSIALEVHKDCLTAGSETVIGGWTTASLRQARLLSGSPSSGHQSSEKPGGAWTQVSRLGQPLVNEVVIGLKDKDKFNGSKPRDDGQFLDYVTNPTLAGLARPGADRQCRRPGAHQHSAHRPGDGVPDRHHRREQARHGDALGNAAAEYGDRAGAVRQPEPPGHRRQPEDLAGRHRLRRIPEWPASQGRRRGHRAGGDARRLVHGQRRCRYAQAQ